MELETVLRMSRDINTATATLSTREVRFLVDTYYQMQENRKRSGNQIRSLTDNDEPHLVLSWLDAQNRVLENQIKRALSSYVASNAIGQWATSIKGIGPVITAGLIAHIEIEQSPTVGHIWSFAGLDPNAVWSKGKKRPWNGQMKTLCWKIGESFVKVMNRGSFYGQVFTDRKAYENAKNDAGDYASQARDTLERKNFSTDTKAITFYEKGKLPPGHIHARCKRYAVKLFLAHLHEVMYRDAYGEAPPKPYAIDQLGHAHIITPQDVTDFEQEGCN